MSIINPTVVGVMDKSKVQITILGVHEEADKSAFTLK